MNIPKSSFRLGGWQGDDEFSDSVLKWNGTTWSRLENKMVTGRRGHTTIVYSGNIYHVGGCSYSDYNNCDNPFRQAFYHLRIVRRKSLIHVFSIEQWSETDVSKLVYENGDEHPLSYILTMFWPISVSQTGIAGKIQLQKTKNQQTGYYYK